jgi:tol-pal system protein YbgF
MAPILAAIHKGRPTVIARPHSLAAACLGLAVLAAPVCAVAQEDPAVAARLDRLEKEISELKAMIGRLESRLGGKTSLAPGDDAPAADEADTGADQDVPAPEAKPKPAAPPPDITPPVPDTKPTLESVTKAPDPTKPPDPELEPEADIMEALADEAPPQPEPQADLFPVPPVVDEGDTSRPRWYGPRPDQQAVGDDSAPRSIVSPPMNTGALHDDVPAPAPLLPNPEAEALYKQGYGAFLQRDYAAAEASMGKLVKTYPNDPLAGSAQYWTGESQYRRKEYKKASDTFLAGYRRYSGSAKAPDMLLRLGMSLAALGQAAAACNSFKTLGEKFPDASDDVSQQAASAAKSAGC